MRRARALRSRGTEVRELAQRSAAAASEIKGLIQNSADAIQRGVDLVQSSGRYMTEIRSHIQRSTRK